MIKRLLGIEHIEGILEDLAQDDVKLGDKIRKMQKDISDLLVYLNVERKESWKEDKKNPLNPPKLIGSKWMKKK
jgi:hypothetical protein